MSKELMVLNKRKRKISRSDHSKLRNIQEQLTLVEMFERFMAFKKTEGFAKQTIEDYYTHFQYFSQFLGGDLSQDEISLTVFREYIAYMIHDRGLAATTANVRIRTIRAFIRFCYEEDYINDPIHEKFRPVKTPEISISALSPSEVKALFSVVDDSTFAGFRDKVMLYTLLDTMVRISECLLLKRSNVNIKEGYIKLEPHETKTKRERIVPLSSKTVKLLKEYIYESDDFGNDILFLTYDGKPYTANSFRKGMKEYGNQAFITKKRVSPHTLRHTGALFYILNGGDPFSLQKILGHTDLSMVRRYIQMADSDVKKQHDTFSPLNTIFKK